MSSSLSELQITANRQSVDALYSDEDRIYSFLQFIVWAYATAKRALDPKLSLAEAQRILTHARLTVDPYWQEFLKPVLNSALGICMQERACQIAPTTPLFENANVNTLEALIPSNVHLGSAPPRASSSILTQGNGTTANNARGTIQLTSKSKPKQLPNPAQTRNPPVSTTAPGSMKPRKTQDKKGGQRLPAPAIHHKAIRSSTSANSKPGVSYGTYAARPHNSSNGATSVPIETVRHNPNRARLPPPFVPQNGRRSYAQGTNISQPIGNNARKRPADVSWQSGRGVGSKRPNIAASTIPPQIACCWAAQLDTNGNYAVCCDAMISSDRESILLHLERAHNVRRGHSARRIPCLWSTQCPSRNHIAQGDFAAHIEEVHLRSDGEGIVCESVGCAERALYYGKSVVRRLCFGCIGQSRAGGMVIHRRPRLVDVEQPIPGNSRVPFDIL